MKPDLSISTWCISRLAVRPARAGRPRRARRAERSAPTVLDLSSDDERDFDASWFESSRALAQGLSVTEHAVAIDVLLRGEA
jgi:hypothetical protein